MIKLLKRIFLTLLVLSLLTGAAAGWWVLRPLPLATPTVDLSIAPQTPVRGIAQAAVEAGIAVQPELLYALFRLSGQSRKLRAGSYEITQGNTALDVLRKLTRGEESLKAITLIDGWTFRQFRAALDKELEGLRCFLAG